MSDSNNISNPSSEKQSARPVHRFKPGVVNLSDIRPQLMNNYVGDRFGFQRVCVSVCKSLIEDQTIKMQSSAIAALDEATQAFMIGLSEDVNLAAIHEKRVTCMAKDVDVVLAKRNFELNSASSELLPSVQNYDKKAINRMGRRGGIKRFSDDIGDKLKTVFQQFIHDVLKVAIERCKSDNRGTVTAMDVVLGLKQVSSETAPAPAPAATNDAVEPAVESSAAKTDDNDDDPLAAFQQPTSFAASFVAPTESSVTVAASDFANDALRRWREARERMNSGVTDLQQAISAVLSAVPDIPQESSQAIFKHLEPFESNELEDAIEEYGTAVEEGENVAAARQTLEQALDKYKQILSSDFFNDVDSNNGFRNVAVQSAGKEALQAIENDLKLQPK